MSYLPFDDVSYAQGNYDMSANTDPIIAIKMGGGDAGMYMDTRATANYRNAIAAGKAVGGYWFAGGTDPIAEANFFLRCMAPLAEDDVYMLDWEVGHADPVGWCTAFVNRIHDAIGVWPWVYMNMSTANAHDWSPVFNNCGYWCAAPSFSFDATLPVKYPQIAQQGPIVNGVDTDAFFGTIDQFKAYGYHAPQAAPVEPPVIAPPIAPTPEPVTPVVPPNDPPLTSPDTGTTTTTTTTTTSLAPQKNTPPTDTKQEPEKPKTVVVEPTYYRFWDLVKAIFHKLFNKK